VFSIESVDGKQIFRPYRPDGGDIVLLGSDDVGSFIQRELDDQVRKYLAAHSMTAPGEELRALTTTVRHLISFYGTWAYGGGREIDKTQVSK